VLFLVNVVLLEYPLYGPLKSLKVIEFDFDIWARTMTVAVFLVIIIIKFLVHLLHKDRRCIAVSVWMH